MDVAVLFARHDSIYKTLPRLDVYDIDRDARSYTGSLPVVAHPPCRAWGRLSHWAKPRHDEKDLARFSIAKIREVGGVLEHPKDSRLWEDQKLPRGPSYDEHGGFTLYVDQFWWGHKARKATALYIVGCKPSDLPPIPLVLGEPEYCIVRSPGEKARLRAGLSYKKELSHEARERTPPDFAAWLVEVARRCRKRG